MLTFNHILCLYRRNIYSSLRRHVGGGSTSREDGPVKNQQREWPTSSQSWTSSVDSELATVGSFDTEVSLDDKQSFAVFSSVSCDSQEHLEKDEGQQQDPVSIEDSENHFASNVRPDSQSNQQICSFQAPSCEQLRTRDECLKKGNESETSQHYKAEITDAESLKKNPSHAITSLTFTSSVKQNVTDRQNEKTNGKEPAFVAQACEFEERNTSLKNLNDHVVTNDSVDEVSSINSPLENSEKSTPISFENIEEKKETDSEETNKPYLAKREPNVLSEIMNFLDDASQAAVSPLPVLNSETESTLGGFRRPGCESINKLHGMSMSQLTEEVLGLQMLVQDKDNKLIVLERALQHQRELLARNVKTAKRELNLRCKTQKEEYEVTLKRHVQFIQQLVEEKKVLAGKCEALAIEMRQQTAKVEYERRFTEERHNSEIRRLKQVDILCVVANNTY